MTTSEDQPPALGSVVEAGRGSLPFLLIHGEALVACAAWALGEAGVTTLDADASWPDVVDAAREDGTPFVLHDPLCPMTPVEFVAACVRRAVEADVVVVGVRPVTDTVKRTDGEVLGATVDRDGLRALASPVVLPASVVAGLERPPTPDLVALVDALREHHRVELLEAPPEARRVGSEAELRVLEALTAG